MRVLFFGDSITQGFYDEQGGWVQRLSNELHMASLKKLGTADAVEAFNLGISGETMQGLYARMDNEIKARLWPGDEYVIVIACGLNDAILRDNRPDMDVYAFQKTTEKVLHTALTLTDKVLCVGLSPVDETLTSPWTYSRTGKQWHNQRIDTFEDTIKQSAGRQGVAFVPVYDSLTAELKAGKTLHSDGLHPNSLGHELIASLVRPALHELLP